MQVILPDEQVKQIQLLLAELITKEIEKKLHHSNLESPIFKQTAGLSLSRHLKQYSR